MIKKWKVTAELNMNASHVESVIVRANTERKARIFATERFKSMARNVNILRVEQVTV